MLKPCIEVISSSHGFTVTQRSQVPCLSSQQTLVKTRGSREEPAVAVWLQQSKPLSWCVHLTLNRMLIGPSVLQRLMVLGPGHHCLPSYPDVSVVGGHHSSLCVFMFYAYPYLCMRKPEEEAALSILFPWGRISHWTWGQDCGQWAPGSSCVLLKCWVYRHSWRYPAAFTTSSCVCICAHACLYVCLHAHMNTVSLGGQKLDFLELELKAVMNHLIWVLGIEFAIVVISLSFWVIAPAISSWILNGSKGMALMKIYYF